MSMEPLSVAKPKEDGMICRLVTGKIGLVDTFWGAYMLGGMLFNITIAAVNDTDVLFILNMLYAVYILIVCIAVWKAASLFQGKIYWAILAKIVAALSIVHGLILLIALPIAMMGH
ncbi:conserved hypothetical protein [Shewanella denitrificans OS217]|uniref:Uncharacterized protein n=2 Tax=Shewanella TaxID=22 RepID=Q12LD8_SHEDO|nr:conserved hypothetical protein [Shewanella denitrificans OS217]